MPIKPLPNTKYFLSSCNIIIHKHIDLIFHGFFPGVHTCPITSHSQHATYIELLLGYVCATRWPADQQNHVTISITVDSIRACLCVSLRIFWQVIRAKSVPSFEPRQVKYQARGGEPWQFITHNSYFHYDVLSSYFVPAANNITLFWLPHAYMKEDLINFLFASIPSFVYLKCYLPWAFEKCKIDFVRSVQGTYKKVITITNSHFWKYVMLQDLFCTQKRKQFCTSKTTDDKLCSDKYQLLPGTVKNAQIYKQILRKAYSHQCYCLFQVTESHVRRMAHCLTRVKNKFYLPKSCVCMLLKYIQSNSYFLWALSTRLRKQCYI